VGGDRRWSLLGYEGKFQVAMARYTDHRAGQWKWEFARESRFFAEEIYGGLAPWLRGRGLTLRRAQPASATGGRGLVRTIRDDGAASEGPESGACGELHRPRPHVPAARQRSAAPSWDVLGRAQE